MSIDLKRIWERQEKIWLTVYAFLTGFNVGRGTKLGAIMFLIGMLLTWWFTKRMLAAFQLPPDK